MRDNHTTAASLFFGSLQTPSGDGDVDAFLALDVHVRKRTLMRWAAKQKDPDWFSEARSLGLFEAKPWSVYDDLNLLKRGLDAFCRRRNYDLFERHTASQRLAFLNAMHLRNPEQYRNLTRSLRKSLGN